MASIRPNPYAADLGSRDVLEALAETPGRIRAHVEAWSPEQFERSYAPGKWPARLILLHLAQTELALGTRARFALSAENHASHAFDQDDWMRVESGADARTALDAYLSLRQLNLGLWRGLTPEQREKRFTHPEYGELTVWWIASQMAGHDLHHYVQLASI